jgi:hypothetical protein
VLIDGVAFHTLVEELASLRARCAAMEAAYTELHNQVRATLCTPLFQQFQYIPTLGGIQWRAATIGNTTFLAVANQRSAATFAAKSQIFTLNAASSRFELFQELSTSSAMDAEFFTAGNAAFIVFANMRTDAASIATSHVYALSALSNRFELFQDMGAASAIDWEAFSIGNTTYLAFANHNNGTTYFLNSRIFVLNAQTNRFDLFQEIATIGATDWEAFSIGNTTYLAVANFCSGSTYLVKSRIYVFSAQTNRFNLFQQIDTLGASDWEAFSIGNTTYLALANYRNDNTVAVRSAVYRFDPQSMQFVIAAGVLTSAAAAWEVFTLSGVTYLAVANHMADGGGDVASSIYTFNRGGREELALVQEIEAGGTHSMEAFTVKSTTYLALANINSSAHILTASPLC